MNEFIKVITDYIIQLDKTHPFFAKIYAGIFLIWFTLIIISPFIIWSINNKLRDIKDLLKDIKEKIK